MKLSTIIFSLILLIGFTFPSYSFAQKASEGNPKNEKTVKELEKLLDNFIKDFTAVPETKDREKVLAYFSENVTSVLYIFNISNRARVTLGNLKDFENYLTGLVRSQDLTLRYEVTDRFVTQAKEDIGTIVYTVDYETKQEDGIWVKGQETVTLSMQKLKDEWKIVHYTIVQTEDEKLRGTCLCELFIAETDDGEVVAKTTVPSGRSYTTFYNSFEFRKENGDQIIKTTDMQTQTIYVFKRKSNGQLVQMIEGEEKEIGVTDSKKDTILTLLRDFIYQNSCTRLNATVR